MEASRILLDQQPSQVGLQLDPESPDRHVSDRLALVHDNDPDLGYTFIPSRPEEKFFSPDQLMRFPLAFTKGLGNAAIAMARHYSGAPPVAGWPAPEWRTIPVNGHERAALVTEPNPETDVPADEAASKVLLPGLTELDIGSALLLHMAIAESNPDQRIVTLPTPGVSLSGPVLPVWEGLSRTLEETATDNRQLLRWILKDGPADLVGTSLGSYIATIMAAQNLSANGKEQLNVAGVKLLSPAVGARNVAGAERFSDVDASDKAFIHAVTDRFFKHMPGDTYRMLRRHPEKAGECVAALVAYALSPHKIPNRSAVIVGNVRGVQEGIEWETIKEVALAHNVYVLGGELDPLVQEQLSQWLAVKKIAPKTKIRVLQGYGHAMTMDSTGIAEHLAQMEKEDLALAA